MTTLFVSDLHLSAARPDKLELFEAFLHGLKDDARALYVLGDLFEIWVGDDDDDPAHQRILDALKRLAGRGTRLFVMPGNRDFLFGRKFCERSGADLLDDYAVIQLGSARTLLTHGDLLCTQDTKYQNFRRVVRNRWLQRAFLSTPLAMRRRIGARTQAGTRASVAQKPDAIMDVDENTVRGVMREFEAELLIHGHTHRPGTHRFEDKGTARTRIVLGDWYEQDNVLVCDGASQESMAVSRYLS